MPARRLKYVTLWYRLQDKYSGRHTEWGGGAILSDNDQGTYFYDLDLSQIDDYRFFEDAWFQYQLVASTVTRRVLGRSVVSRSEISINTLQSLQSLNERLRRAFHEKIHPYSRAHDFPVGVYSLAKRRATGGISHCAASR